MTKSVTIVNTSNWKGEDISVKVGNSDGIDDVFKLDRHFMKPGETLKLNSPSSYPSGELFKIILEIEFAANGNTEPLYDPLGKQILPHLSVEFK